MSRDSAIQAISTYFDEGIFQTELATSSLMRPKARTQTKRLNSSVT